MTHQNRSGPPGRRRSGRLLAGLVLVGLCSTLLPLTAHGSTVADGDGIYAPAQLTLTGLWTTSSAPANLTGVSANLAAPGDAQLTFRSTGITWVTSTNNYSGIADVYVDGVKNKTVDLYSATTKYQQPVFKATGLTNSTHILKVVRTGTLNPASVGRNVHVDAFVVLDVTPPAAATSPQAAVDARGVTVTWTPSTSSDVQGYKVLRQVAGGTSVLVATVGKEQTRLLDAGPADNTAYTYRVVAFDDSNNEGPPVTVAATTLPPPTTALRYANCPAATVSVTDQKQLLAALGGAASGTVIRMAPGQYFSNITITGRHGTAAAPIWLCGPPEAELYTTDATKLNSFGIKVVSSSYLVIAGMTVTTSQKGIEVSSSHHITVADTQVKTIGDEALHLKNNTTDSTLVGNIIKDTGLLTPRYGEGIYIGTDKASWTCSGTVCTPDATVRNQILNNNIRNTTADPIEAKEATADTVIAGNTVDGSAMDPQWSELLIKVKGNRFTVRDNVLSNSSSDAIVFLEALEGHGRDNVAYRNQIGAMPKYGIRSTRLDSQADPLPLGNIVGCDNTLVSGLALSNQGACQN